MRLQHLHLLHPVPYPLTSRIQEAVVRQHINAGLDYQHGILASPPAPVPFLLTFQTTPTYTCGRREIPSLTSERIEYLKNNGRAAFFPALRGGQTTFHGPGQLTAYLILTMNVHNLRPRCYVRFLETSVKKLCAHFDVPTTTTDDPGVWLVEEVSRRPLEGSRSSASSSKICAVGIHMRRGVTSHGIGLNVHTDLNWFKRIIACGLVDKRVTSLEEVGVHGLSVRKIAILLSHIIAEGLESVNGVETVDLMGSVQELDERSLSLS